VRSAAEDQLTDGNAPRIKPCDERQHCPRWHEGSGAVQISDGFRHRLGHVSTFMEDQLHECCALNALALDPIDSGSLQEVILQSIFNSAPRRLSIGSQVNVERRERRDGELKMDWTKPLPDGRPYGH
jgi:hypothetical protein